VESESKRVVVVPSATVRDGSVFVVAGGKAIRKNVKVDGTTSQGVQVSEGLIGGEDLVANPPADLKDGQKVQTKQR
jgi:HlyD family secretion protein